MRRESWARAERRLMTAVDSIFPCLMKCRDQSSGIDPSLPAPVCTSSGLRRTCSLRRLNPTCRARRTWRAGRSGLLPPPLRPGRCSASPALINNVVTVASMNRSPARSRSGATEGVARASNVNMVAKMKSNRARAISHRRLPIVRRSAGEQPQIIAQPGVASGLQEKSEVGAQAIFRVGRCRPLAKRKTGHERRLQVRRFTADHERIQPLLAWKIIAHQARAHPRFRQYLPHGGALIFRFREKTRSAALVYGLACLVLSSAARRGAIRPRWRLACAGGRSQMWQWSSLRLAQGRRVGQGSLPEGRKNDLYK